MKTVTWIPDAISVAESEGSPLPLALVITDAGESTVIPLGAGDAERIAHALLGIEEIPSTLEPGEVLQ